MKLQIITLTIILFLGSTLKLFSQVTVSTRIGLSTLNEIQLEVINQVTEKKSIYTSVGYAYRSFNFTGPSCGTLWPSPLFNKNNKGFTTKLGMLQTKTKVNRNKTKIRTHTISIFYRRYNGMIRESEFVNESGCGTSPNFYDYEYTLNDMGLTYINGGELTKTASFYWSISVGQRFKKRKRLSIFNNSQGIEKTGKFLLLIDFGFRFKLV